MSDWIELERRLRSWSPGLPVEERTGVLGALAAYWHGPPPAPYPPVSASLALPGALAWLYAEIAARQPDPFNWARWVPGEPLLLFNSVRSPSDLEVEDSGIFPFLLEEEGVFRCGARAGEEDGPVFRRDRESPEWRPCAERLSDFLLWLLLFELNLSREEVLWGYFPAADAAAITGSMLRVDHAGVSTYGVPHRVYHGDGAALLLSAGSEEEVCLQAVAREIRAYRRLWEMGGWSDGGG